MGILYVIIIGIIAGWLAGKIVKGGGFGLLGDLVVGVLGAVIGSNVFAALGVSIGGNLGVLVMATFGAVILLVLIRVIKRA